MRMSRSGTPRTFAAIACLAAATSACAAVRGRPDPSEEPAPSRTGTSSDTRVEREHDNQSFARIEELIEGRAPGVRVIRHQDGSFRLQIRGVSSPAGRNDPLIVVDGTPARELHAGSALASLNPSDVERIEVLKDAASTAFYGMRGANGVIVITTRQH